MGGQLPKKLTFALIILALPFGFILTILTYRLMSKFLITFNNIHTLRNDAMGQGHFGAPRGTRTHKGIDIVASPNEVIFAPFKCIVTNPNGQVYNATEEFRYIEINGVGLYTPFKMRFMYVAQDFPEASNLTNYKGTKLIKGAPLGVVQDIANYHGGGMINHVHVELRVLGILINPAPFFKLT